MYRTHTCGELRLGDEGKKVVLAGWVQSSRDMGGMTFIDLRDRYGITQLTFNEEYDEALLKKAREVAREYVLMVEGTVRERSNKNPDRPTGEVEIEVDSLTVLNRSEVPPFTIEENTDGGEELRLKYRYLDLRRPNVQQWIMFRSKLALETRKYLAAEDFVEVETPFLIKSTPEGARDFVVPSRLNPGHFYALPQSPQTFKQLLMVSGLDRYFQLVKCFRDEDFRADRQPEFTQIDCEMAFVNQEDVLRTFEGLTKHLFKATLDIELEDFPRMSYDDAMRLYGSDKPDLRFEMAFTEIKELTTGRDFRVFDQAEWVGAICVEGVAEDYSNKDLKKLTEWVQRPQVGAKGLVYVKFHEDGSIKSSVSKFYSDEDLQKWGEACGAAKGDMLLIISGDKKESREQLGDLRLEMGRRQGLIEEGVFKPLWVLNFPLLEWDHPTKRFFAMHHPFTSPTQVDIERMSQKDWNDPHALRADAYDLVINGMEIGGGSIRIHNRKLQERLFEILGLSAEEAKEQFGFLLGAFEYGAPPHGGIAFGFDRLSAIMQGRSSIRDVIAFPKNNQGRDLMIDAPARVDKETLDELGLEVRQND